MTLFKSETTGNRMDLFGRSSLEDSMKLCHSKSL